LFDGTELGKDCTSPAIDRSRQHCTADADKDATRTGALSKDSDFGGVQDGVEDVDHNGRIDPAELDPNDPDDDVIGKPCMKDPDCGGMMSGIVCKMGMCAFGCRGMGGNTCPSSLFCSSTTNEIGMCSNEPPDAGVPPVTPPPPPPVVIDKVPLAPDGKLGGAGCNCRVLRPGTSPDLMHPGLSVLALLWLYRRRARKQARHKA